MSIWKVILATLVIFCAGLFTGGLGVKSLLEQRPPPRRVVIPAQGARIEMLSRMTRELELDDGQRTRLDAILAESQERNREIVALVGPELREEFRRTIRQIRQQLNAEQRQRFDKLLAQRGRRSGSAPADGRVPRSGPPP